jgi:hypothetical protein
VLVGAAVVVLVVVDVLVLLVVVVVGSTFTGTLTKFVHTPTDCTLIVVVPSGTFVAVYPAIKAEADIFVANGIVYPSVLDKRLKGPASPPGGKTTVINTVMFLFII